MTLLARQAAPAPPAGAAARRSRWLLWGSLLALALVHLPLLGPALLGQGVLVDTGAVLLHEPWLSTAREGASAQTNFTNDTVEFYLPRLSQFVDRLWSGEWPMWEPYAAGGTPLAAVSEAALLSPLNLPYLLLPDWLAPAYVRLLTQVVAVGATALFLRRLRLSPGACVFGGLLYSVSGFVVLWHNWPQSQIAALVPALFWAVERALQERRAAAVVPVALVTAAMLLASFPGVLVHALYLLGPYVLVRTLAGRVAPRALMARWALVGGGLLLGVGLAAFQLLPWVERVGLLELGYRTQDPTDHPPVSALLTTVVPYAFGTETDQSWYGYYNTVETISWCGVVGVALCVVALVLRGVGDVPRGVVGYVTGSIVTIVLVGWVGGPFLQAAQLLPLVDDSYIARIRSVLMLAVAVLAAVGAERLVRLPDVRATGQPVLSRRWPLPVLVVLGTLVVAAVGAWRSAQDADRTDLLLRNGVPALAVAAGLAVALALLVRARRASPPLAAGAGEPTARSGRDRRPLAAVLPLALVPVLLGAEALAFAAPRWTTGPRSDFYPTTSVHAFLARELGGERVASSGTVLFPSTDIRYGLRDVTGHAFQTPAWKALITSVDPRVRQGSTVTYLGESDRTVLSPVLDRLAARFFVASTTAPVLGAREPARGRVRAVPLGDRELVAAVPAGAKRAVVLQLEGEVLGEGPGRLTATFTDDAGRVVGVVERFRVLPGPAGLLHVPLVEGSGPAVRATRVRLALSGVTTNVAADAQGAPVLGVVRPRADGLRVAFAAESVVYERATALPRVRWAGRAVRAADPEQARQLVGQGVAGGGRAGQEPVPQDTVVLTGTGPGGSGAGGQVQVLADTAAAGDPGSAQDALRVRVRADGDGWLVVADALQHGWAAYVDGRSAPVLDADAAVAAVPVPGGEHTVELRYEPPGLRPGLALSGVATVLTLLLGAGSAVRARRYRGRSAGRAAPGARAAEEREDAGGDGPR